jgi:hypothetical protein
LTLCGAQIVSAATPHDLFDGVLQSHVRNGQVDYPGIDADPRYKRYLDYLRTSNTAALAAGGEELAFWINAYNALVIRGILDGNSPANFLGRIEFFRFLEFDVGGRSVSLHVLEHEILRPLGDPRIHFALVCASSSCPKLREEAYSASHLDEQLQDSARQFINDSERNRFDEQAGIAHISKIFAWFKEDFRAQTGTVPAYIASFVEKPSVAQGLRDGRLRIEHLPYDWRLNGIQPAGVGN